MKGNWGSAVGVTLVFLLITYAVVLATTVVGMLFGQPVCEDGAEQSIVGQILSVLAIIFVVYPIVFGTVMLFLQFAREGEKPRVGNLFKAFSSKYYGKSVGVYLLTSIFTSLWALLLIVPGIIKTLAYSLAPYILIDNPELTANQALNQSVKMMKGHKMQLCLMMLGYVGFTLLSVFALCIPLLWIYPYYQAVLAKFYEEVKSNYTETAC